MPSLKHRVADQRDILIAHGTDIHHNAEQVHSRLSHPVVVIPAFLAGILFERAAPLVLRGIPEFNSKLVHFTDELRRLDASIRLITGLIPVALQSFRTATGKPDPEPNPGPKA